tara:strand:+ start:834 stop:1115 length:282 start_codon:yes stop_codon:yes gene_type:complete
MSKDNREDPQAEMRARIQKMKGRSSIPQAFAKSMNRAKEERLTYQEGIKMVRVVEIDLSFWNVLGLTVQVTFAGILVTSVFIGLPILFFLAAQ